MNDSSCSSDAHRKRVKRVLWALLFVGGAGLLVWLMVRTDMRRVWERVRATGWWFTAAFSVYVCKVVCSTESWRELLRPDARVSRRIAHTRSP